MNILRYVEVAYSRSDNIVEAISNNALGFKIQSVLGDVWYSKHSRVLRVDLVEENYASALEAYSELIKSSSLEFIADVNALIVNDEGEFDDTDRKEEIHIDKDNGLCITTSLSKHNFSVEIVGLSREHADEYIARANQLFSHLVEIPDKSVVRVSIASKYQNGSGASQDRVPISCPEWADVERNYSHLGNGLSAFMEDGPNVDFGHLIIWHGIPGTGKTWAIKSLIRTLRETHGFVVVSDVDQFLSYADYYYSIISSHHFTGKTGILFILEDAASYVLTEKRAIEGAKMSKLLNLTDGLLAQGRQDLFLLTFNEEIKRLDPAIVRPGRCQSRVEFKQFDYVQAQNWLNEHGFKHELDNEKQYSLADLYHLKDGGGRLGSKELASMGFKSG